MDLIFEYRYFCGGEIESAFTDQGETGQICSWLERQGMQPQDFYAKVCAASGKVKVANVAFDLETGAEPEKNTEQALRRFESWCAALGMKPVIRTVVRFASVFNSADNFHDYVRRLIG